MRRQSSRLPLLLLSTWAVLGAYGCKKRPSTEPSPKPAAAAPSDSASVPAPPAKDGSCRALPGWSLTVTAPGASPEREATEEGDDVLLPFGVDVGAATASPFGFAAGGIEASRAFVALLTEGGVRQVPLGELHGDPDPPLVAAAGSRLIVAATDSDAAGKVLRVGRIDDWRSPRVEWSGELSGLGRSVSDVALGIAGDLGLLAWQTEHRGDTRVMLAGFSVGSQKLELAARVLETGIETPRLASKPDGFWLAYVRGVEAPRTKRARPAAPDGGVPEDEALVDPGVHVLEVVPLDPSGQPRAKPVRVAEPRRQAFLFDLVPQGDGSALVAYRTDTAVPGVEEGALTLVTLLPDGTRREQRLADDDIGAGAPTLLAGSGASPAWLAVSSPNDVTRFGVVAGLDTALGQEPAIGSGELLSRFDQRVLVQRSRGRSVDLFVVECDRLRGEKAPAPPPTP